MRIFASCVILLGLMSWALAEDKAGTFEVAGVTFTSPASWKIETPKSPMRKAQLAVGGAQVVFFHFGATQGGSVADNVARWTGQFQDQKSKPSVTTKDTPAGKATFVEVKGTFLSGMPGSPKTPMKDQALAGAILASSSGNIFIKMTGPEADVDGARADFFKMVEGAKKP